MSRFAQTCQPLAAIVLLSLLVALAESNSSTARANHKSSLSNQIRNYIQCTGDWFPDDTDPTVAVCQRRPVFENKAFVEQPKYVCKTIDCQIMAFGKDGSPKLTFEEVSSKFLSFSNCDFRYMGQQTSVNGVVFAVRYILSTFDPVTGTAVMRVQGFTSKDPQISKSLNYICKTNPRLNSRTNWNYTPACEKCLLDK